MTQGNSPEKGSVLQEYASRVRAFKPNARYYLFSALVAGATMGVFRLLFNFYALSLGYSNTLLGNLITTSNMTALFLALPIGYLISWWGRKQALMARIALLSISVGVMAIFPDAGVFYLMNGLIGISMSLGSVAMGPFLMENSDEHERTYLFSFASGIQMASVFVGNWLGGYVPTWVAEYRGVDPTSSGAYGGALLIIAIVGALALIPLSMIKQSEKVSARNNRFDPLSFAKSNPKALVRLFSPLLLISIGAGLFVPFMNVFFRVVHNKPDPVIGSLMAWGSLAMGVGLLIAPPLADRLGKLRLVALTQGLSIPFMIMLGFSPLFGLSAAAYYVRMALMNMSNPVYQNFVLEQVDEDSRATIASLHSMVWNFGRAFSPSISGWMQDNYGFGPPFIAAISLYAAAIFLYWVFFLRKQKTEEAVPASVVTN